MKDVDASLDGATMVDVTLASATIAEDSRWRRNPPRNAEDRQEGYEESFDHRTLFYDVFRVGEDVELIGPPLLNLTDGLRPLKISSSDGRRFDQDLHVTTMDRLQRYRISGLPRDVDRLLVECPLGTFDLPVGDDLAPHFAGKRVLVTQSKNNPLSWIVDWVSYHVATQTIDAVIIYDNASTAYSPSDIESVLARCAGLGAFAVVSWPFPFGATGGPQAIWDSDYGQHGCWEHAWRRLCRVSGTITFADVDELILGQPPSVADRALDSDSGMCCYPRRAVLALPNRPLVTPDRTYVDYPYYEPDEALLTPKYTVAPSKLADHRQLMVHRVQGIECTPTTDVLVRHFDGMRIDWRLGDVDPVPNLDEAGPGRTAIDTELVNTLKDVFQDYPSGGHPATTPPKTLPGATSNGAES